MRRQENREFIEALQEDDEWEEGEHFEYRNKDNYITSYHWAKMENEGLWFTITVSIFEYELADHPPYFRIEGHFDLSTGPEPDDGAIFDVGLYWAGHTPEQVIEFYEDILRSQIDDTTDLGE